MSSMNNLSLDGELRYIIQWFNEWSELQRDDFLPILIDYLNKDNTNGIYLNGIVTGLAGTSCTDKPMNLFQCRIKLFREWSVKWPEEFKEKLKNKVIEIDTKFGDRLTSELTNGVISNHHDVPNGLPNGILENGINAIELNGLASPPNGDSNDEEIVAIIAAAPPAAAVAAAAVAIAVPNAAAAALVVEPTQG